MSSTEARFSFTTKINGDLFTVRGDTYDEFHNHLAQAVTNLTSLINDVGLMQAAGHATPLVNAAAPAAAPAPAPAAATDGWDDPPASFQQAQLPACQHGPRTARTGTYKSGARAGQQYRAYFCPSPKGTPDQCSPLFLNPGTPEWAGFPA